MSAGHMAAMEALRKMQLNQFRNNSAAAINLRAVPKPVTPKKKLARRKGKM